MEIRQIRLSGFPFRRYTWPLFGLEVQFAGDASVAVAENCRGNDGMAAEVSVKYSTFSEQDLEIILQSVHQECLM